MKAQCPTLFPFEEDSNQIQPKSSQSKSLSHPGTSPFPQNPLRRPLHPTTQPLTLRLPLTQPLAPMRPVLLLPLPPLRLRRFWLPPVPHPPQHGNLATPRHPHQQLRFPLRLPFRLRYLRPSDLRKKPDFPDRLFPGFSRRSGPIFEMQGDASRFASIENRQQSQTCI